jgi:hypothetical protein
MEVLVRTALKIALFPALILAIAAAPQTGVSVREEKMSIPTWEIGPPTVHSQFPNPTGPIYPYTLNETLTDKKVDKTYTMVYLENEYVRIGVLPEIGGRLFEGIDKEEDAVSHFQDAFDLAAEIGMAGRIHNIDIFEQLQRKFRDFQILDNPGVADVPVFQQIQHVRGRRGADCQHVFFNSTCTDRCTNSPSSQNSIQRVNSLSLSTEPSRFSSRFSSMYPLVVFTSAIASPLYEADD